jgi:hypothetical protein
MLAPYPDRLRSSRSNTTSSSQPQPQPQQPQQPQQQHSLFHSRSALPLTRMRTNSLTSSSPSHSHRSDSPATTCNDSAPPRLSQNSARRPLIPSQPSTSPLATDHKPAPVVPIVFTSPLAGVSPVTVRLLISLLPIIACQYCLSPLSILYPRNAKGLLKGLLLLLAKKALLAPLQRPPLSQQIQTLIILSYKTSGSVSPLVNLSSRRKVTRSIMLTPQTKLPTHEIMRDPLLTSVSSIPSLSSPHHSDQSCSDVWETSFLRQLSGGLTFHVFVTPPTKVYVSQLFPKMC